SSQPATGMTPRLIARRSRRNVGRISGSPSGSREAVAACRLMAGDVAQRNAARQGRARTLSRAKLPVVRLLLADRRDRVRQRDPGNGSDHSGKNRRSALGLRLGAGAPAAALGHELIELGLILGVTQALQKFLELALLLLEPAQGLAAIFVDRPVPARPGITAAVPAPRGALGVVPPAAAAIMPTSHHPS